MENVSSCLGFSDPRDANASRLRSKIAGFLRRRLDRGDETDDLVQDVFLRVAGRQCEQLVNYPAAYFYRCAASVLSDRYRRRQVRRSDDHIEFDPEQHTAWDFDPARILEGKQSLRAAVQTIDALPERTRTIFLLRRLEGRAYGDIASQLGISVSAVEKHMARAVHRLALTV